MLFEILICLYIWLAGVFAVTFVFQALELLEDDRKKNNRTTSFLFDAIIISLAILMGVAWPCVLPASCLDKARKGEYNHKE